jgi:hypothetical protein
MLYRVLADLVVLAHIAFVAFVVFGGLLVLWRSRIAWLHVPVVLYAAAIEIVGWVCPLTPLEKRFRALAGEAGYEGGFIEHYAGLILYPANWHAIKGYLAAGVIIINLAAYALVILRLRRHEGTVSV